jgi:2,4-dienoyl-CoA reductase-like NADH-dependent reductase (Old Yellow Enzyme family)
MSQNEMPIAQPFELQCGLKLSNRIVKASMEEMLGSGDNQPNDYIYRLYERWAKGSFGLILTGNVQIDERYPGLMTDMMIPSKDKIDIEKWKRYANVCQRYGTPAIVQINHAGRQSPSGKRPFRQCAIAPSPIPLSVSNNIVIRTVQRLAIGTPDEMTRVQIDEVVEKFVEAADIMVKAGFAGVELHGSHGYLISSFLSPKTNQRNDEYGATPKDRMRFLFRIIDAVRAVVPRGFAVGVKLNSADFSVGGLTEDEAYDQIRWIDEHGGIDFIEISGGTYEAPAMTGSEHDTRSERTRKREAYFIEFAAKVRHTTKIPLIVTGGFRTREGMNDAIRSNACDFVGIARPVCIQFNLPQILLDQTISDKDARAMQYEIRGTKLFDLIPVTGARSTIGTIWHNWQMHRVAIDNQEPDPTLTFQAKIFTVLLTKLKQTIPFFVLIFAILYTSYFAKQFFLR